MFDKLKEECGIFGIYDNSVEIDVVEEIYLGLYALQHRGQESCGMAINQDGIIKGYKNIGLITEVFTKDILKSLPRGNMGIGHVRYSTTGDTNQTNAQPMIIKHIKGPLALAHNGNLVNAYEIRNELQMDGVIFHTTSDTEVIAYKIARERIKCGSIEEALEKVMYDIKGAYCLLLTSPKKMLVARDPNGFRPLCIGKTKTGGYVFASETCALDTVNAKYMRDVRPGEIIVVENNELRSIDTHCGKKGNLCVFEFIYFARPDSKIEGADVNQARQRAGAYLALEHPVAADVVIGVPDSGLDAALGYSKQSGIPYGVGLIKNRYIGRTFIQPQQSQRENSVKIKLNTIESTVNNKRVVLVDDSIVRGTTSKRIVDLLKDAGAKEVHMRISAPPFKNPCYFGTDIDSKENLIACKMSIDEIAKDIGVDSLGFLSVDDTKKIAVNAKCDFCTGCFSGEYPIDVGSYNTKDKFEDKIS